MPKNKKFMWSEECPGYLFDDWFEPKRHGNSLKGKVQLKLSNNIVYHDVHNRPQKLKTTVNKKSLHLVYAYVPTKFERKLMNKYPRLKSLMSWMYTDMDKLLSKLAKTYLAGS